MPGRMGGQPQTGEFNRGAILHFEHAVPRAESVAVEASRGRGGKGQLMAGDVVGVRVRDEAAGLAAADVDTELGERQEYAGVVVEHLHAVTKGFQSTLTPALSQGERESFELMPFDRAARSEFYS